MGKFYIYSANIEDKKYKKVTIVFNSDISFDFNALKNELSEYFSDFYQTSALIFIHCSTIRDFKNLIDKNQDKIFMSIPKVEEDSLKTNIFSISYDRNNFSVKEKFIQKNLIQILNQGLANIFIKNGGLVESSGISHHYVFPSGRHSNKFLRTANVLVRKSEIDFIAINTLHHFESDFENIYCDTLSIAVVGYSLNKFISRFRKDFKEINIESFKSYDGLYNKDASFYNNSIFLISASTSGGLINYIQKNHPEIHSKDICTLFYLPLSKDSNTSSERILCNLSINEKLGYGIESYETFKTDETCSFCKSHSTAISIVGDSFSLDEPKINTKTIVADPYITQSLKDFVELFKYKPEIGTSLKVSFSENSKTEKKYNLYIDYEKIISNIGFYEKHKAKMDAYIKQYIPASIKHIIYLNDKGSEKLAQYINDKLKECSITDIENINQIDLHENQITSDISGSILIVGSCITNGKNLLYLSRFFRNFENIRLIYFVGINRVSDGLKYKELKSNIKYGLYGAENSSFIEVETIKCDNSNVNTPWYIELEKLKDIQAKSNITLPIIRDRINILKSFSNIENKGGDNNIFYTNIKGEDLEIRKNSAFFNNNLYYKNITQSDVYFTICCVLNNMRNDKDNGLFQTAFVKNILSPFIFNRFNDGIIQASILRGARDEELNYSFSFKNSEDMFILIRTFIRHIKEYQGEAIFEFLYALSIGKLKLHKSHYKLIFNELSDLKGKIGKADFAIIEMFKHSIEFTYKNIYNID